MENHNKIKKMVKSNFIKNNLLNVFILVIIILSVSVLAGNVFVKEGEVTLEKNFVINNSNFFVNTSNGKIGIGTTSPDTNLEVQGTFLISDGTNDWIKVNQNELWLTGRNQGEQLSINYNGYQDGATQFRNVRIYNGKHSTIALFDGTSGSLDLPNIAAGAGTDYVCIDTSGTLSSGASCTKFEGIKSSTEILSDDEFKVLSVTEQRYPDNFPLEERRGKIKNYFYNVAFNLNSESVEGTIKVPGNMEDEKEIIFYLTKKIESEREVNSLVEKNTESELSGKIFKLSEAGFVLSDE